MKKPKKAQVRPSAIPEAGTPASDPLRTSVDRAVREHARRFGALIRERREALGMRQDDLALATGVGRRFVIDLEAGKPSCQLGRSLLVATAVGVRPFDIASAEDSAFLPDLPDIEAPHER